MRKHLRFKLNEIPIKNIKINVKKLTGKIITLDVSRLELIETVKRKI
jgi:hypothetical protein